MLRFMEAEADEDGLLVCRTDEGEHFSAEYLQSTPGARVLELPGRQRPRVRGPQDEI